ncbi:hypothetical protein N7489_008031 [Penicillium chrysogenum]|uniref:Amine oxidase domain-containing protein n=1 Tax=Penicillium chrysogenum TaxID=5076 RepID=A0ABQ8WAM5_PENCH|nr:uncharacterized protein N7489_008031 [Penicillium chrysogenum]KAJ5237940.1 hypothetical protein N7489_008031 [Penicillium chrysogenum]KAJ5261802.1 hypothetical protein N7505_008669 [Penicillium chrysogenum]KAJ6159730.1 hypothetical protein N7497_004267 [Penicillium chrysogenum]
MKLLKKFVLLALGVCVIARDPDRPVCIVGAGPAGLSAAAELELKGYRTVTFEKQSAVGGKCQAVYENSTFSPLGALIFTPPTYRESIKLLLKTGRVNLGETASPPQAMQLFMQEVRRYVDWWNKNFVLYNIAPGYPHGIPTELTIPAAEWLARNGYQTLQAAFVQSMVAYGYGDYRQVPIVYMLQYLTPSVLMTLLKVQQGSMIEIADFHRALQIFADRFIAGKIHLDTTISRIDRTGESPIITYQTSSDSTPKTQSCAALILAFPPTLSSLQNAGLDVTDEEREVFTQVGTHSFYSGARPPGPSPDATGDPVVFTKLHGDLDIAITSSWGPYRGSLTRDEAYARLKSTLSAFNKDPRDAGVFAGAVSDENVLAFQENDYFPHYDSQQLREGYYELFEALQGQKGTYYASGFNMFELVEYALRAGQDVTKRFF